MDYSDLLNLRRKTLLIQAANQQNPTNSPNIKPHFNQDKFTREGDTNGAVDFYVTKSITNAYSNVISGGAGAGGGGVTPVLPPSVFVLGNSSFVLQSPYRLYDVDSGTFPTSFPMYLLVARKSGASLNGIVQTLLNQGGVNSIFPARYAVPVTGNSVTGTLYRAQIFRLDSPTQPSADWGRSPEIEITTGGDVGRVAYVSPLTTDYTIIRTSATITLRDAKTGDIISVPGVGETIDVSVVDGNNDSRSMINSSGKWTISELKTNTVYYITGSVTTGTVTPVIRAIAPFYFKTSA